MTTEELDRRQYDPREYRLRLSMTILAVAVFYAFAVLWNAAGIKHNIELMRYGKLRDSYLSVFSPVAEASERLGMTKPRKIIEESIGRQLRDAKINP